MQRCSERWTGALRRCGAATLRRCGGAAGVKRSDLSQRELSSQLHSAAPDAASRSGTSVLVNTMTSVAPLLPSNTPTRAPHRLAITATSSLRFSMADSPASPPPPVAAETPAQEKARLRRERLAAKLATGGATRLQQISALQGGPPKDLSEIQKDLPGTVLLLRSLTYSMGACS